MLEESSVMLGNTDIVTNEDHTQKEDNDSSAVVLLEYDDGTEEVIILTNFSYTKSITSLKNCKVNQVKPVIY